MGGGASKFNRHVYVKLGDVTFLASSPLKQRYKNPEDSSKLEVNCNKTAGKVRVPFVIASGNSFVERAEFPHGHGSRNW
jgi:hypothetical protein